MPSYIVGYDGSDASEAAVRFAYALAQTTGARVTAGYVYPATVTIPYPAPTGNVDLQAAVVAGAQAVLDGLGDLDVIRRAVPGGGVVAKLHELARDEDADLLVVGTTHRGTLGQMIPGSVAERLVHHAPCPVLVVPTTAAPGRIQTVAVADDGRTDSQPAIRAGEALAERFGATVRTISVDTFAPLYPDAPAGPGIVAAAKEDADLLVMGSRGFGPLRGALAGAASRYVVDHAPCPVLVVPRGTSGGLVAAQRSTQEVDA